MSKPPTLRHLTEDEKSHLMFSAWDRALVHQKHEPKRERVSPWASQYAVRVISVGRSPEPQLPLEDTWTPALSEHAMAQLGQAVREYFQTTFAVSARQLLVEFLGRRLQDHDVRLSRLENAHKQVLELVRDVTLVHGVTVGTRSQAVSDDHRPVILAAVESAMEDLGLSPAVQLDGPTLTLRFSPDGEDEFVDHEFAILKALAERLPHDLFVRLDIDISADDVD